MNKQVKLIISIIVCVVLFIGAGLLYNNLKDDTNTQGGGINTTESTQTPQSTQPSQESNSNPTTEPESTTKKRTPAPDITVTDVKGQKHKLSDFKGKPVFLNFWATWCGPCKIEMPEFQKAYEKYGDKIEFVIVNVDGTDSASVNKATKYIEDNGYTFPVYYDTLNEGSRNYGISSIPATYLVDEDGNIIARQIGAMNADIVETAMEMLLEG